MTGAPTPDCLDENAALAFVERALGAAERARREAHLDGCATCRRVVSELARELAPGAPEGDAALLGRGATLGRYVLLDVLGAGAMGVVYAAYDPELDRKVALKLLQAGGGEGASLAREARAMARVDHPNVVRVYDAGGVGGRFYFVMEVVEGTSLAAHVRERSPGWREVLALFVKAGRGLEAAHRAGLVHRDFKPDNVLVGRAGAVRVTDFGLARPAARGAAPAPGEAARPGATASFAGTPAYMAPEQLRGERVDARSDQFGFCVALYEALYGVRPFEGAGAGELLGAIESGARQRPARGAAVPARVRRALARGLSAEPARRFATMGDLLDALSLGRARRALVAFAAVAALGVPALAYGARRARAEAACAAAEAEVGGAWGAARRERVRRAFEAASPAFAAEALRVASVALDRYAGALGRMRGESCRATLVRGEQPPDLYQRRSACLDERLAELEALVARFERPEPRVVERAGQASHALGPVARCADATALLAPVAEPPALRPRVAEVRRRLTAGRIAYATGSAAGGLEAARRALGEAESLGHAPLVAEALLALGYLELDSDDAGAERHLLAAVRVAESARADLVKARAAANLSLLIGYNKMRYQEGLDWADFALAALERVGGDDFTAGHVHGYKGTVLTGQGKHDEAAAAFERAFELYGRAGASEHDVASTTMNLAAARLMQRRLDEAIDLYGRALRAFADLEGARSSHAAMALSGRASTHVLRGDAASARADYAAALALFRDAYGPEHPYSLRFAAELDYLDARYGDATAASARLLDALAAAERILGPAHQVTDDVRLMAGRALYRAGRVAEALAPLARVAAERAARLDPNDVNLFAPLLYLGEAELALGRLDEAEPHLAHAHALARARASMTGPAEFAEATFALARSRQRRDPGAACALAREARDAYERERREVVAPLPEFAEAAAVDAWLAARPCPAPPPEPRAAGH